MFDAETDVLNDAEKRGMRNGVMDFLNGEYNNLKAHGASLQTLSSRLAPYDDELFIHVVSILQSDAFAEKALANFMIAAGTHLAILQEEALVDPDHPADPFNSGYAFAVATQATKYATHATETAPKVIATRMADISKIDSYCSEGTFQGQCLGERWFFKDKRKKVGEWTTEAKAKSAYNNHVAKTRAEVTEEMDTNINAAAALWLELVDNPIPIEKR